MKTHSRFGATISEPYLVYTALMSQTGVNAPTAVVLQNTLSGTIVWTRTSPGLYVGTLAGAFPVNKTWCISINGIGNHEIVCRIHRANDNQVEIYATDTNVFDDDLMVNVNVKIEVYP